MARRFPRRRFLQLLTGSSVLLAGCNSDEDPPESTIRTTKAETTTTRTTTSPPTSTLQTTTRRSTTKRTTTTENDLVSMQPARFSLTFEQEGVTSDFLKVSELVLRGGTGHKVGEYDIGTDDPRSANEPEFSFVRGVSEPHQSGGRTWRTFDSPTTIAFPGAHRLDSYSAYQIECRPRVTETPLQITSHDGNSNTTTVTADEWQTLYFSFHD